MITAEYCRLMARYNLWQNKSLLTAAGTLDDAARKAERGAFFGSIAATLSHLLWGDMIWMSRFDGGVRPPGPGTESPRVFADWVTYLPLRRETDVRILDWASSVGEADLEGDLIWYSGMLGREISRPKAMCIVQFFNHQTHHRGQVHCMLTAAGTRPDDTDVILLPDTLS